MADETYEDLRTLVAEVAAAYFANSHVGVSEIGPVIDQIAASLSAIGGEAVVTAPEAPDAEPLRRPTPAQIRKSITSDAIFSFEDGRGYKTLRRHLSTRGLTPEQYREKWSLPADYPLVAPSYSAARSQMAKAIGLGAKRVAEAQPARRRGKAAAAPE